MEHEKRHDFILNVLQKEENVNVQAIANHFGVAPMTVRRDLAFLERKGLLVRRYGGAVKSGSAERLFSFAERMGMHKVEKTAIGKKAAELIQNGDTIFIDCGSTPYQMARHISGTNNIRIITNSLPVVSELIVDPSIRIIFAGGEIVNDRRASQGPIAERALAEYRADKAFIGVDGVSLKTGLTAFNEMEGIMSKRMAAHAREVYLLCDSSKLEKDSFYQFAPIRKITAIVTDDRANQEIISRYRQEGVSVIIA
ncbi:MAG: DeoR/GlpR transcriptional regulator [Fibrobacteres bacterium]|nr:DeoR/GlpR transcriptional regulator [Fibrobacterota bacterium]